MSKRPSKVPTLEPSRKRIERAKHHLTEFKRDIESRGANREYGVFPEGDEKTGEQVLRAKLPFDLRLTWGLMVGDVTHSLRSALDNLIWQLVLANGRDPTFQRNSFPIFLDVAKYGADIGTSLAGVRRDAATHIEGLQPYHARNAPEHEPLWLLHDLDNWDKHRVPNMALIDIMVARFRLLEDSTQVDLRSIVEKGMRKGPFQDGAEVARFSLPEIPPKPPFNVGVEYQFDARIAFEQGGPGKGHPVLDFLDALTVLIDQTVNDFAVYFPP